jgi:hypothetical protein
MSTSENNLRVPQKLDPKVKGFLSTIIAATISQTFGIVVGHPLDTMKVRMQMTSDANKLGVKSIFLEIIRNEGPSGLFKGMMQPLFASVPNNSIVFILQYNHKQYML